MDGAILNPLGGKEIAPIRKVFGFLEGLWLSVIRTLIDKLGYATFPNNRTSQ